MNFHVAKKDFFRFILHMETELKRKPLWIGVLRGLGKSALSLFIFTIPFMLGEIMKVQEHNKRVQEKLAQDSSR